MRALPRYMSQNSNLKIQAVSKPIIGDQEEEIHYWSCKLPLRFPGRNNEGFLDLLEQRIIPDMIAACESSYYKSIMIDTGTQLWEILTQAHLERVQKSNENKTRQNLIQIEYARPNLEARALYQAAKSNDKSLISIHHLGAKYGVGFEEVQKGKNKEKILKKDTVLGETWKGFTQLGQIVDTIVRHDLEWKCTSCNELVPSSANGQMGIEIEMAHSNHLSRIDKTFIPTIVIEECGFSLNAQGTKIESPSYKELLSYINLSS